MDEAKGFIVGTLGVVILIAGLFVALGSWVVIGPGQRGVVTHFGKITGEVMQPGLNFKCPVVTGVKKFNCRVMAAEIAAEAVSKDLQTVTTKVVVNWHPDPEMVKEIFERTGDEDAILGNVMAPALNEVVKASTAQLTAEEVVSKRLTLKESIDVSFKTRLKKYGILVDELNIVNLDFSPEFNKAIEAKQVAEQRAKQAKYEADQAAQDAQAEINKAKGAAESQRLRMSTLTSLIIQDKALDKWNGVLPTFWGGQGSMPLLDLKSMTAKVRE
jgi:regulator of protease activity HflC (stomatin/prohibitin superfamily)